MHTCDTPWISPLEPRVAHLGAAFADANILGA